ncbi:MAG TPA: methyltransferase domain-containing protein [Thermomonospora sp.]|nr:methyltransferase domain-containing protein [Thermomonospora sp.]
MGAAPRLELDSRSPEAVDGRQIRAVTFQDVRLEYLATVLPDPAGTHALVVGGGRGLLPRGLARLGMGVTAADPSPAATAMAREAAEREGLPVDHDTAPAERLPYPDDTFDLVYVADTFEITDDLDQVVREAARVLRRGGLLVYDTVNRTPVSRLIYLGAFQKLPMTRIMPPGRYAADRLRRPEEVAAALTRHGLVPGDVCAFKPKDGRSLVRATLARRRGEITDEQIPPMVRFVLDPGGRPVVTYFGHARKS